MIRALGLETSVYVDSLNDMGLTRMRQQGHMLTVAHLKASKGTQSVQPVAPPIDRDE